MFWPLLQEAWRPAIEILILSVGIYRATIFVRGTRGAPVVTGFLVLLLALSVLANALDLRVIQYLLAAFLANVAIAAVILFHPELRRMLAQLGNISFVSSVREQRENIEVIVETAERLSEVRIGALIAVERSIQVEEAVESGIEVDCVATPEMLETIFFPNNAIHDGGVIISGDRISHAACIFPLTQRQDLNRSLGTRHRAAIGLSEETDAVVVVVSEETGFVSYAYQGKLIRRVSLEKLRAFLTSVLVSRSKSKGLVEWFRSLAGEEVQPSAPAAKKED